MTDEAMVEAVARALAESWGADPDLFVLGRPAWRSHKAEARAAIRAVVPLIIEQCAEVAEEESCDNSKAGRLDEAFGAMGASNRIRALTRKEAL